MARVVRSGALLVLLVALAAFGYGAWTNEERGPLDASARATAPGKSVALSHGTTQFDVTGPESGPVAVLVHGFSVPMYIWDSTFTALGAAGYRVIRYDLYGRGWSDRPDAAYDGAMYDAQLDELLDSLRVTQPVHLVGLSFGGFVASHYAAGHAGRVRTLTLVDPVSTSPAIPGIITAPVIGPWIWQVTQMRGKAESQYSDFLHPERYPTWADQYRPQMRFEGFGRSLLRSAITVSRTNFDSLFTNVHRTNVPVLLVWGAQDRTTPIAQAANVRARLSRLEFFPVDSAGHLPHIEQAAHVSAKLQQFFALHSAVAASTPSVP